MDQEKQHYKFVWTGGELDRKNDYGTNSKREDVGAESDRNMC
jgi:hypothetical protein